LFGTPPLKAENDKIWDSPGYAYGTFHLKILRLIQINTKEKYDNAERKMKSSLASWILAAILDGRLFFSGSSWQAVLLTKR